MNKAKHNQRSHVPQFAADKPKKTTYINHDPQIMHGWSKLGNKATAFLSIRFVQKSYQCFSEWTKQDMDSFWSFVERLHNLTWEQILAGGGKGSDKTGLRYTPIPKEKYPSKIFIESLDPEIGFFELSLDMQRRVHGFRDKSIFYLCWLDRNHELT